MPRGKLYLIPINPAKLIDYRETMVFGSTGIVELLEVGDSVTYKYAKEKTILSTPLRTSFFDLGAWIIGTEDCYQVHTGEYEFAKNLLPTAHGIFLPGLEHAKQTIQVYIENEFAYLRPRKNRENPFFRI